MHSDIRLPERVIQYLSDLPYPVRVLEGNANQMQPPRGWNGHARSNGATLETCQQEGVTLISWAMDACSNPRYPFLYYETIPARITSDGNPRHQRVGMEWIQPAAPYADEASFSDSSGMTYARSGDRIVWYAFPLQNLSPEDWEHIDLDKLFGEPIGFSREVGAAAAERERLRQERIAREQELEAERERRRQERQRDAARESFMAAAEAAARGQRDQYEREYQQQESYAREYEQNHARAMTEIQRLSILLRALDADNGFDREQAQREWDALINHPKVTGIRQENRRYMGECTVITTPELIMTDPDTGESHPLGAFDIFLPGPASGQFPQFHNLTNPRNGRHHPHVDSGGSACFGGSHSLVSEMVRSGSLAGLFEFMIQYLESYNPQDSYGMYARDWGFGVRDEEDHYEESYEDEDNYDADADCDCADCRAARGQ